MKYIRKKLIITGVIMVMGLGLTGCTKTDENAETSGGSAVEAEDLPGTKEQGDEEAQTNNSGNVEEPEAEDADKGGQDADSSDNSLCTIFRTRKRIFVVIFVKSEINSLQ